jgi:hypothetical protein
MKRSIACVLVPLAAVALLVAAGCNNKKDEPQLGTSTKRAKVSQNKQTKQSKQARNAKNKQQQPEYAQQSQQQRQPTAQQPKPYKAFGEQMRLTDADAVPVEDVLADPSVYQGRYVRLVGNVKKVCTRKGCWLEMADGSTRQPLFVKFTCPIDGRLIPMEAVGRPVTVEGTVMVKEISEEDARHLKEESGATPAEVAKIKGPQRQVTLESPGARVAGIN